MKTNMLKVGFILYLFCIFGAGGCEKDEESQLPPISQNGAGTFGCLINGEIWNADPLLFGSPLGASNNQWEDRRWVIDAVGTNYTFIIEICRDSVINGASMLIGTEDESCSNATIHKKSSQSADFTYHTTNQDMGKVTITRYDTIQKIISGTFYFDAINSSGDQIKVRNGRFDIRFINYEP